MSLRVRLVLIVVGFSALALTTVAGAVAGALQDWRSDRYETTLSAVGERMARSTADSTQPPRLDPPPRESAFTHAWAATADQGEAPAFFQLRDADGQVLQTVNYASTTPDLDTRLPDRLQPTGDGAVFGAVDARTGEAPGWFVRVARVGGGDALLVVAMRTSVPDAFFGRITGILTASSLAALLLVALVGSLAVRRALRPLDRMAATADVIRAGDLTRRVASTDPSTEVGRLATALNAMLERIESSVAAQERSAARLRQFVADASHELKTPVATIRGYAELFRRGAADRPDDLRKVIGRIEAEADRMGVLVEDLLQLANLDQDRPLERERVDLRQLAVDAVDDTAAAAPDRSFRLVGDDAVPVSADAARVRQAIGNLLSNVIEHTPASAAATVRVSTADGFGIVEVADEGPGIAAEDLDRIFERFFRTGQTRSGPSGGAGLGLAIVTAIADAHGGDISATSVVGSGTTFRLRLPAKAASEQPADTPR